MLRGSDRKWNFRNSAVHRHLTDKSTIDRADVFSFPSRSPGFDINRYETPQKMLSAPPFIQKNIWDEKRIVIIILKTKQKKTRGSSAKQRGWTMVLWLQSVLKLMPSILPSTCLIAPPSDSAVSCYRIEPGTVAGVISTDVLLTLVIVIITYKIASSQQKKIKTGGAWDLSSIGYRFILLTYYLVFLFAAENIYMNTRTKTNKKNKRPQKRYQTVE